MAELVTNAVRHAPGPVDLELSCDGCLRVAVTDTSTSPPVARIPDLRGGGGFGWHLVVALADRLEVRMRLVPPDGKTITVSVPGH